MSIKIRNIEYVIIKKLGEGGSGRIIQVKSKSDNKYYAIKEIIIKEAMKDKIKDIQKEADILSKFNSYYIVKYYGSHKINNKFYILMEYCDGKNLRDFLNKNAIYKIPIEEKKIYNIIKQICEGIKEMHDKNIIHRDLKPENIFMNEIMEIKIGDFGISKQFNPMKEYMQTLNKAGSIFYMAPEILVEGKYNKKSDMYSLGCIIYELFHLNKYYNDREYEEIKTIDSKKYNNKWQEIINSLLQVNPDDRMNINQVLFRLDIMYVNVLPVQKNIAELLLPDYTLMKQEIIINKQNEMNSKLQNEMNINNLQNEINDKNIINNRIKYEFKDLQDNPLINMNFTVELPNSDNFYKWRVSVLGPFDTSYKGGFFYIEILFPNDYPINKPTIHFLTPIYHVNVNQDKSIYKNSPLLGEVNFTTINFWRPSITMRKVLIDLYGIFYWVTTDYPHYEPKLANEYLYNKTLYEKKVKYFTKKYANGEKFFKNHESWDFSFNEKDFELQESSELIHKKNIEYNNEYVGDKIIYLHFEFYPNNNPIDIIIDCELKELTGIVISRFMIKIGLDWEYIKDILFIFKNKNLNHKVSILDNGLEDGNKINVIYNVAFI